MIALTRACTLHDAHQAVSGSQITVFRLELVDRLREVKACRYGINHANSSSPLPVPTTALHSVPVVARSDVGGGGDGGGDVGGGGGGGD